VVDQDGQQVMLTEMSQIASERSTTMADVLAYLLFPRARATDLIDQPVRTAQQRDEAPD
jgi:hypothetical protein